MLSYPSGDQELCVPELEKMETAFQAETCNMKRVWLGGGRREGVCVILGLQNAQKINKIRLLKKLLQHEIFLLFTYTINVYYINSGNDITSDYD